MDTLEDLRFKVDQRDNELLQILKERMELVKSIGQYKKKNNMTILQPDRWEKVLHKSVTKGKQKDLNPAFVSKLFTAIHQESINKQTIIMND